MKRTSFAVMYLKLCFTLRWVKTQHIRHMRYFQDSKWKEVSRMSPLSQNNHNEVDSCPCCCCSSPSLAMPIAHGHQHGILGHGSRGGCGLRHDLRGRCVRSHVSDGWTGRSQPIVSTSPSGSAPAGWQSPAVWPTLVGHTVTL